RESMRRLDAYRAGRVARHERVAQRGRAMYKLARGGMLRFTFEELAPEGKLSTAQRLSTGRSLRWLVRHDLEEMSAYQRAEVRAESELLAATRELQVLSALATVQTMQHRALEEAREAVRPELRRANRTRKRIAASSRTSDRAREAQKDLQRQVSRHWRKLTKLRGLGAHGRLLRPVPGKIVGKFGEYDDPILELPMVRHGVELRARTDDAAYAIDDGRVVLISRLPGFDDVVVLDHGEGQLSMTGRLWKVAVAEGDELSRGTLLGHVAPKAVDDGLGGTLYLEIRHGDRPIDPAPYLKRARKR
ncbi:MAG: peptidoglycan DD-metalloendopeptidase family protein, partial [Myxococcota bacterium]